MIWLVVLYLCVAAALAGWWWDDDDMSNIPAPAYSRVIATVAVALVWPMILIAAIFGVEPDER